MPYLAVKRLHVLHVLVDVALDEAAPAQHPQLRALLRLAVPLACASFAQIIGSVALAARPAPAFSKSLRLLLMALLCKSSAARRIEKIGQLRLEAHRRARLETHGARAPPP